MKNVLFIFAAAALCGCSNPNSYTIDGNVEGLQGMVYLSDGPAVLDSAVVENGKFRFKGVADQSGVRYISDSRGEGPMSFGVRLILEPGTILITSDKENAQLKHATGTPVNDANDAYSVAANGLVAEFRAPETTDERREAIQEEYDQLTRQTIDANRDNYLGVMLLPEIAYGMSGQETLDEIAKFSPAMQQTQELTELKSAAEQKLKTDIGQPYINIMQGDADGKIITLTSVIDNPANKYTLVDFWASWCGPCMAEVPYLVQTYKEFHGKGFEIYGVSFDKDKARWLAAVKDNGLNWIQVSDLNAFDNPAAKDYAVQGIPSNFLIDAQGKIVAKNLRGEEVYEKIAELLK